MYAYHFQRAVHGLSQLEGYGAYHRRESVRRNAARRRMEPAADDSDDENQPAAGGKASEPGTIDRGHRSRRADADEPFVVDRRQALQLPVRLRDWMGNQEWQTRAHGEESVVLGDHDGVLEFAGRDLLARRVDAMGNSELRERSAATGDG